ncbi:MAG: hypothetical protein JXX14_17020, partial [Deltaproteobacteria bacterium]|nr:hypothetical protein [Deltaproteobacteria bacterium]
AEDTGTGSAEDTGTGSARDTGTSDLNGDSIAAQIATKLGRPARFLVGLGNVSYTNSWSDSPVFGLPVTLDFHYEYLVGLPGEGGWTEWNDNGRYPIYIAEADIANGVIPMVTVYQMAAWGDGNTDVLDDPEYMTGYWDAAKILMERYGNDIDGHPAVVHVEPDFWGYIHFESNGNPASMPAILHPECAHLPDDVTGIGKCWVYLARTYAPNVIIGLHASEWGIDAEDMANTLLACGGGEADVVFREFLDRDAGCFEAGVLPQCQRNGEFYLDETNQTSPNFREHLEWTKTLSTVMEKPVMWWQVPLGVPSDTPGGTPGHYRDNRVKYIFDHPDEFVAAGGLGVCFGTGASGQTTIESDGGQFATAVTGYFANPTPLP